MATAKDLGGHVHYIRTCDGEDPGSDREIGFTPITKKSAAHEVQGRSYAPMGAESRRCIEHRPWMPTILFGLGLALALWVFATCPIHIAFELDFDPVLARLVVGHRR